MHNGSKTVTAEERNVTRATPRPGTRAADQVGTRAANQAGTGESRAAATELAAAFKATLRAAIRLRGRDTHLGGAELSHAQLELLIELYERGELPAGELAAAARLSPATVTPMLDHLAAAGHVERVRSPSDRRVVVSRLTPEGRRLLVAKREDWERRWQQALSDVSERDLRAATRVLKQVQTLFDQAQECASDPAEEA